jgi:hypothetical protein
MARADRRPNQATPQHLADGERRLAEAALPLFQARLIHACPLRELSEETSTLARLGGPTSTGQQRRRARFRARRKEAAQRTFRNHLEHCMKEKQHHDQL